MSLSPVDSDVLLRSLFFGFEDRSLDKEMLKVKETFRKVIWVADDFVCNVKK